MTEPIQAIVETAIYVHDLVSAEAFYHTLLQLPVIVKDPDRHVFFQVGDSSVLLAFLAEVTKTGDELPAHGCRGSGHLAMGVSASGLNAWKRRLQDHNIHIEKEIDWPQRAKSIYFRDPSGNSVELLTPGLWGLRSGW